AAKGFEAAPLERFPTKKLSPFLRRAVQWQLDYRLQIRIEIAQPIAKTYAHVRLQPGCHIRARIVWLELQQAKQDFAHEPVVASGRVRERSAFHPIGAIWQKRASFRHH